MILYLLHGIIVNLFIVKSKPFNSSSSKLVKRLSGKGRNLDVCSGWDMVASLPLPNRSCSSPCSCISKTATCRSNLQLLVGQQQQLLPPVTRTHSYLSANNSGRENYSHRELRRSPPLVEVTAAATAEATPRVETAAASRSNRSRRRCRRRLKKHETNGWLWSMARVTSLQCVY